MKELNCNSPVKSAENHKFRGQKEVLTRLPVAGLSRQIGAPTSWPRITLIPNIFLKQTFYISNYSLGGTNLIIPEFGKNKK